MADIGMDADEFHRRVTERLEGNIIGSLTAQKTAYINAESAVSARNQYWYGGKGATGRLQAAGEQFLSTLGTELGALVDSHIALIGTLQQYAAALHGIAEAHRETDNVVADRFTTIDRGFGEGR